MQRKKNHFQRYSHTLCVFQVEKSRKNFSAPEEKIVKKAIFPLRMLQQYPSHSDLCRAVSGNLSSSPAYSLVADNKENTEQNLQTGSVSRKRKRESSQESSASVSRQLKSIHTQTEESGDDLDISLLAGPAEPKRVKFADEGFQTPVPLCLCNHENMEFVHDCSTPTFLPRSESGLVDSSELVNVCRLCVEEVIRTMEVDQTAHEETIDDSGIVADGAQQTEDICETPKKKTARRQLFLAEAFENEPTDAAEEEEQEPPKIEKEEKKPVAAPKKRGRRGRRAAKKTNDQAAPVTRRNSKPAVVKQEHICDYCYEERATAAILKWHMARCTSRPAKTSKKP